MVMPAFVIVITMILGAGGIGVTQLRAYEAARAGAREAARGEPLTDVRRSAARAAGPGAQVRIAPEGEYTAVTVTISTPKALSRIVPRVSASARARTEGTGEARRP